jgi:hypothetical protein
MADFNTKTKLTPTRRATIAFSAVHRRARRHISDSIDQRATSHKTNNDVYTRSMTYELSMSKSNRLIVFFASRDETSASHQLSRHFRVRSTPGNTNCAFVYECCCSASVTRRHDRHENGPIRLQTGCSFSSRTTRPKPIGFDR